MMQTTHNPIGKAFSELKVRLPAVALDCRPALSAAGVTSVYVIAMTGRSGSTWLTSALKQIPGVGHPAEYFSESALRFHGDYSHDQSLEEHIGHLARSRSTGGRFGFKINPRRLDWLGQYIDLQHSFAPPFCSWIDMKRRNIVKQAFSFARAHKSGKWHDFTNRAKAPVDGPDAAETAPDFHPVEDRMVWHHLAMILGQEQQIETFYRTTGFQPLRIFYEEISDSKAQLLIKVLHHIGAALPDPGDLGQTRDGTRKLARDPRADEEEYRFCLRYADLLGEINLQRAEIDVSGLTDRISDMFP